MKHILIILILLIKMVNFSSSNLQKELKASIDKALMTCSNLKPPLEPVLAISPSRYPQLVALLNLQAGVAPCGPETSQSQFSLEDETTWHFCTLGNCKRERCICVSTYTGPRCTIYKRKCWLMYCFLSSCNPTHQSFACVCDSKLYGRKVLTGDYWYDDGKRKYFEPPPPDWKESSFDGSKIMTSSNAKSKNRLIPPPDDRSMNDKAPELKSEYDNFRNNKMDFDDQKSERENINYRPSKIETYHKPERKLQIETNQKAEDKFQIETNHKPEQKVNIQTNHKPEQKANIQTNHKPEAVKQDSVTSLAANQAPKPNKEPEPDEETEDIKEALEEEVEEASSTVTSFDKTWTTCLIYVFVMFLYQSLHE